MFYNDAAAIYYSGNTFDADTYELGLLREFKHCSHPLREFSVRIEANLALVQSLTMMASGLGAGNSFHYFPNLKTITFDIASSQLTSMTRRSGTDEPGFCRWLRIFCRENTQLKSIIVPRQWVRWPFGELNPEMEMELLNRVHDFIAKMNRLLVKRSRGEIVNFDALGVVIGDVAEYFGIDDEDWVY